MHYLYYNDSLHFIISSIVVSSPRPFGVGFSLSLHVVQPAAMLRQRYHIQYYYICCVRKKLNKNHATDTEHSVTVWRRVIVVTTYRCLTGGGSVWEESCVNFEGDEVSSV